MFANVERDQAALPALREVVAAGAEPWETAAREILSAGFATGDEGRMRRVRAAVGLAMSFGAWQWLVRREGLAGGEAVELLARGVEAGAL